MSDAKKDAYRCLCETDSSVPLFSRAWWLDAVCGEHEWDVAIVWKSESIVAAMPYYIKRRLGYRVVTQPPFTQTAGPWIRPSNVKSSTLLAFEKDVMGELIDQLPPYDHFSQNWHYSRTNWLPFYWRGFRQSTRYTYVLPDLKDEATLWSGLRDNVRTDIRKATQRFALQLRDDVPMSDFLRLVGMTFERQGKHLPFAESAVERLDRACVSRQCRMLLVADDANGAHQAGVYVVWDEHSAYYLLAGRDTEAPNTGANSFLLWEAIKRASTITERFDFEGSMMEPVERFFRGFGGIQMPYFNLSRTPSRVLRLRQFLLSSPSGADV